MNCGSNLPHPSSQQSTIQRVPHHGFTDDDTVHHTVRLFHPETQRIDFFRVQPEVPVKISNIQHLRGEGKFWGFLHHHDTVVRVEIMYHRIAWGRFSRPGFGNNKRFMSPRDKPKSLLHFWVREPPLKFMLSNVIMVRGFLHDGDFRCFTPGAMMCVRA